MFCFKCGHQLPDNSQFCTACGTPQTAQPVNGTYVNTAPTAQPLSMKWHKFLIYFLLFASAVLNLGTAVGYITGNIYEYLNPDVTSEMVYNY